MKPGIYLLMAIVIFVASCTKNSNVEIEETPTELAKISSNSNQTSYSPLQLALLAYSGEPGESFDGLGSFGRQTVEVFLQDTLLAFLVPQSIAPGNYSLQIPGFENSVSVNVIAGMEISNPDQYVTDFVNLESMPDGEDKNSLSASLNEFNSLPQQQKLVAATFIANNRELLDALEQDAAQLEDMMAEQSFSQASMLKSASTSDCGKMCMLAQVTKVALSAIVVAEVGTVAAITTGVVIGIDVGLSIITGKRSYILNVAIPGLLSVVKAFVIDRMAIAYEKIFDYSVDQIGINKSVRLVNNFEPLDIDNKRMHFVLKLPYRTLNQSDAGSGNSYFAAFIDAYNKMSAVWSEYFSEFGTWPSLVDDMGYEVAKIESGLSVTTPEDEDVIPLPELNADGTLSLGFTSSRLQDNATFGLSYTDEYGTVKSDEINVNVFQNGKLSAAGDPFVVIEGKEWKLKFKVTNNAEVPLQDAMVYFDIAEGDGELLTTSNGTGEDGITEAYLRMNDSETKIVVRGTLKNNAGKALSEAEFVIEKEPSIEGEWVAISVDGVEIGEKNVQHHSAYCNMDLVYIIWNYYTIQIGSNGVISKSFDYTTVSPSVQYYDKDGNLICDKTQFKSTPSNYKGTGHNINWYTKSPTSNSWTRQYTDNDTGYEYNWSYTLIDENTLVYNSSSTISASSMGDNIVFKRK